MHKEGLALIEPIQKIRSYKERFFHSANPLLLVAGVTVASFFRVIKGWRKYVLLPFALLIVSVINMSAWLFSLIWPDWQHMTHGHIMQVRKI